MTTGTTATDPPSTRRTQRLAYTSWIERTCRNDPGARSALRSGLRRGIDDVPRMHRMVTAWLPKNRLASDVEQRAYYAVAAMIAAQPRSSSTNTDDLDLAVEVAQADAALSADTKAGSKRDDPNGKTGTAGIKSRRSDHYGDSLGKAFALAVTKGPGREREMRESTAESRLNLLTRQSTNGLHRHLPASVGYLRELGVPVDWAQLLDDLIAWPVHSSRISRRWLQDYYRLRAADERAKAEEADQQEAAEPGTRE